MADIDIIYFSGGYAVMTYAVIVCIKEIFNIDREKGLDYFIINAVEIVFTTIIGFSFFIFLSWLGLIIILLIARNK